MPPRTLRHLESSKSRLHFRIDKLFSDVFLPDSQLLEIDPRQAIFMAAAVIARGAIEISDLRRNIDRMTKQLKFVPWNQNPWKTGLCDVPPLGTSHGVLAISNTSAFWRIADRIEQRFGKVYRRGAHLHHYLDYMEKEEFETARESARRIVKEYKELEL